MGMNSENGHNDKTHEISSLGSKVECADELSELHSSNKISSRQERSETSRSKVKKPDMPIYVPRGRRIVTEAHLKLGDEEKLHQIADDDDQGRESNFTFSKDEPNSETKQPNDTGSCITKKKSAGKKKMSKKTSKKSEDCQSKKMEKVNGELGSFSKTLAPCGGHSLELEVELSSKANDPVTLTGFSCAPELGESADSMHESANDKAANNLEISVDDCSVVSKGSNINSAADCTFTCVDGLIVDNNDASIAINSSEITVNASQPSFSNWSNSETANDVSFPNCLNLAISSKNSIGNEGKSIVKSSDNDIQTEDMAAVGDQSWDALFDDNGEALHAEIMTQITDALGAITVQKPQFDYLNYQPREPEIGDEEFEHLLEIYDFPASLQTADLVTAFKDFQDNGFEIKWVDDTHAIGVFSGQTATRSALATFVHPLMKVRPIQQATRQTKLKAKKCTEFLQPYKPRPVMVASVARNLVAGALGLQTKVSKEKREEERQKIKAARDQKRAAKRQKEDVWEGKFGRCAMDEV